MNIKNTTAPTANNGRRKIKNDIIFIVALLFILICAGLAMFFLRPEGECVVVTVDGKEYGIYSLSEDAEITIGDGHNILVIKNGEAYMKYANCPDGICTSHRPISREGESIVCLPNRVAATVKADAGADSPDIVV